jgi:ABC-2 type transport system ATP-binding protein
MLQFTKFTKSYGPLLVLQIGDLVIKPGIYWVRGANGSGKTSLLKAIAGIIDFDGDIIIDETISLKKHPVQYRKIVNFAEAEPLFPEFLTGQDMINLFVSAKNAAKTQADHYIETMKMGAYIQEPIGTYSSGMLKKLSIVLAFLGNPKLILLDEPLITIDTDSLKILYKWIEEKHAKENVSFLISSHHTLDGLRVAHQLVVERQTAVLKST